MRRNDCILFDAVFFVSGTVQAPQLIGEVTDKIHRQRVVGPLGQFHLVLGAETDDQELHLLVVVDSVDHQELVVRIQHLAAGS